MVAWGVNVIATLNRSQSLEQNHGLASLCYAWGCFLVPICSVSQQTCWILPKHSCFPDHLNKLMEGREGRQRKGNTLEEGRGVTFLNHSLPLILQSFYSTHSILIAAPKIIMIRSISFFR